jgi:hypothetical protein
MILTRRRFLQVASSTLFVAPAIVRASSLMKIWVPEKHGLSPAEMSLPDLRTLNDMTAEMLNESAEITATEVMARRTAWADRIGFAVNEKIEAAVMASML